MFFNNVKARNFGPFEEIDISFRPDGLNIVHGPNASGKSQLAGAILAALIGKPAVRIEQGGLGPSIVILTVGDTAHQETIGIQAFTEPDGSPAIERSVEVAEPNRQHGSLYLDLLSALSNPSGPRILLGAEDTDAILSTEDLDTFDASTSQKLRQDKCWLDFRQHITSEQKILSEGWRRLASLVRELAIRSRSPSQLPLIVDDALWVLDDTCRRWAMKVLDTISESTQVILLTSDPALPGAHVVHTLSPKPKAEYSLASYNGIVGRQRPNLIPRRAARWVLDDVFPSPESRACELKEVKGANPVASIKNTVDEYAVAFLNAGIPQEGRILWGIRDADRRIVGVRLSDLQCDQLKRAVTEQLHKITPPVAPTAYRVELHPVSDGRRPVPELYIVEVRIPATRRTLLFSTGGQDVWVKTDAGKKKLSAVEVQQELLRRVGLSPDL